MTASSAVTPKEKLAAIRWKKSGPRSFRCFTDTFNAIIFGAPEQGLWAWGVYADKFSEEGIAYSLMSARLRALEAVRKISRRGGS